MKNQYQLSSKKKQTATVVPAVEKDKNEEKRLCTKPPDKLMRCGKSTSGAWFVHFGSF